MANNPSLPYIFSHITNDGDTRKHSHHQYELVYMLSGPVKHYFNGIVKTLHTGDFILISPGQYHYFFPHDTNIAHRDICINQDFFVSCCSFLSDDIVKRLAEIGPNTVCHIPESELIKLEKQFHDHEQNYFNQQDVRCKLLVFELLKYFLSTNENKNDAENLPLWLQDLLPRFHEYPYMQEGLTSIMNFCAYHPVYVCRIFKKYMGMTMGEYLLVCRLNSAASLLMLSNKTITDIAYEVGFSSVAYFNKVFKDKYQLTPSNFRKKFVM